MLGQAEVKAAVDTPQSAPPSTPDTLQVQPDGSVVNVPKGTEPELIGGKFKTVDDLLKSYQELESKMGAGSAEQTPPAKTEEQKAGQQQQDTDLQKIGEEFARTGTLTEAHYESLQKKGFDRATVDKYLQGQSAIAQQTRAELAGVVGGEERLTALLEWAGTSLPKAAADAYNAALDTGNMELAKIALTGLAAQHEKAFPTEPGLVTGGAGGTGNTGPKAFANRTEMLEAMRNPAYKTDPVYRRSVEQRVMLMETV